ncbi:ROK family transcriptional regulator [Antiquaquibacter soli]|uniref:ROK family transcriptional regulator n=1 Tax=Antiquaquibacter soli TaxID=3064523 RepID=A0ABT9BIX7_9MICO|nr:ROK family transcriptional regulator [Protaetiibacter sp. WY-16]MDO7880983.1 ROK family transcriptional regulator [Protaetiibacter sp. WY-16]
MSTASAPGRPWPDLPETERRVLLDLLLHGSQARVRLAERIGLSRASLTRIARGLMDAGLVSEGAIVNSGSRGRPGESLDLQPDAARFLGLKLTGDSAYLVCTNLAAAVVAEAEAPLPSRDFDEVVEFLGRFIADFVTDGTPPVALGVAVAGDVVTRDGEVLLQRSNFLGWHDVPLAGRLEAATGLPVTIANDVQALTGAHHWFGGLQKHRSLVVFGLGAGIGSGVVLQDELLTGTHGRAGRVGHHRLDAVGRPCENGHVDCVHSFVTMPAIAVNAGVDEDRYEDALALARAGDAAAARAFALAAEALGIVVADAVNAFDPEIVSVMGEGRDMVELAPDRLASALADHLEQSAPEEVVIDLPPFQFGLYARGAAVAAMRELLS